VKSPRSLKLRRMNEEAVGSWQEAVGSWQEAVGSRWPGSGSSLIPIYPYNPIP
jgi:hypothetical protein